MTTDLETILRGSADAPTPETELTTQQPAETPAADQELDAPQTGAADNDGHRDEPAKVPLAALKEERSKVKRYTEQIADFEKRLTENNQSWERRFNQLLETLQRPPPAQSQLQAPDFFEDPNAFVQHAIAPLAQGQRTMREQFSSLLAVDKYGVEKVNAAYSAFEQEIKHNPALRYEYERIMASPHPYGELVAWYDKHKVIQEIGSDPIAYREKLKAEVIAEHQQSGQAPPPGKSAPPLVMPSNLAGARNVGTRTGSNWSGPKPLADIFNRHQAPG